MDKHWAGKSSPTSCYKCEVSRESLEERFRAVTESATDPIISVNSEGKIVLWNRAAENVFGYSEKEVIDNSLTLIIPERYRESHETGLKKLVSTGISQIIGYDILNGIEFPWPVSQAILQHHEKLNGSGYPEGLSGEKIILEARILTVADVVEAWRPIVHTGNPLVLIWPFMK
ncbi:MAG: PAS domain S-box protein [Bacillota bacterium]